MREINFQQLSYLVMGYFALPIVAYWFIDQGLSDDTVWFIISICAIIGVILFYANLPEIKNRRKNK